MRYDLNAEDFLMENNCAQFPGYDQGSAIGVEIEICIFGILVEHITYMI